MSFKFRNSTMSAGDIVIDTTMNDRFSANDNVMEGLDLKVDTYSLGMLLDEVVQAGRINTPLVIDGKTKKVLQGFRRASVAKKILANQAYAPELRKEMERLPVNIYSELTDQERSALIHDKGTEKGIGRAELIRSSWRMLEQGFSEKEISNHLRYEIARYTGNSAKLNGLPDDVSAREKIVQRWFHGTVGQYFIASYYLGPRVRKAVLLTELAADGLLPKDENGVATIRPEFVAKRGRIGELVTAAKQDREQKLWDDKTFTGPALNAKIAEYIEEDTTGVKASRGPKAMTQTELETFRNTMAKSKIAIATANRVFGSVPEFPDLDQAAARWEAVGEILQRHVDNIASPQMRELASRILHTENLADFETYITNLTKEKVKA